MYLDTSVLVKLYVNEPDSVACDGVARGHTLVSSELAYGEMLSALLANERAGHLGADERALAWNRFIEDHEAARIYLVPLNGVLVQEAADLMEEVHPQVPLRTLDAIHLATFLSVDAGPLFTRDRRMLEAARRLNLPLAE
ncbi:MAG TPA: type II toxin-antitoxin system VapC family toxin [Opitutus sp.]|nr:type II toxin-antitoxin system VapC family toxin [Opitutus sp.]